jgi:hypothetical protein
MNVSSGKTLEDYEDRHVIALALRHTLRDVPINVVHPACLCGNRSGSYRPDGRFACLPCWQWRR